MDGAPGEVNLDTMFSTDERDSAAIDESPRDSADRFGIDSVVLGMDGGVDSGRPASRLEFRLLADPKIAAREAIYLPLESLVLAPEPLFDLDDIDFVRKSEWYYAFRPSFDGDALLAKISDPHYFGLPFVVLADGERVFLGGIFLRQAGSSYPLPGPEIIADSTTRDGFYLSLILQDPPVPVDARNDPRIITVLTETGKLVP
jgi:hypothetical protein